MKVQTLLPGLAGRRILVIGDVILDEYLTGRATRMSREAPVPVLEFESRRLIPGGAANPAANIAALGSQAIQAAVIGDDDAADQLTAILHQHQIDTTLLIRDPARPTTLKTRIMAQMGLRFPQQLARLDRLSREPISAAIAQHVRQAVLDTAHSVDALLFSDYHGGMLTPDLVQGIREALPALPLTADAQGELGKYVGFTLVKCNADDARAALHQDLQTDDDFGAAAAQLYARLGLSGAMVITRGADGATLATTDGITHQPAPAIADVFDTVGAGDTAIAVMTLALVAGADYATSVALSNVASGLVVRRLGNYTPTLDELKQAIAGRQTSPTD